MKAIRRSLLWSTVVIKISSILNVKMVFLPLILGCCLDYVLSPVFNDKTDVEVFFDAMDRHDATVPEGRFANSLAFQSRNIMGSLMLHWEMGITFMLSMTMMVLTLREALHPDFLSLVIRPQEPQFRILSGLVKEKTLTHCKRTCLTFLIYVVLLVLFVYIPIQLLVNFVGGPIIQLRTPYFLESLQLPVEIVTFRILMLHLLDNLKVEFAAVHTQMLHSTATILGLHLH